MQSTHFCETVLSNLDRSSTTEPAGCHTTCTTVLCSEAVSTSDVRLLTPRCRDGVFRMAHSILPSSLPPLLRRCLLPSHALQISFCCQRFPLQITSCLQCLVENTVLWRMPCLAALPTRPLRRPSFDATSSSSSPDIRISCLSFTVQLCHAKPCLRQANIKHGLMG